VSSIIHASRFSNPLQLHREALRLIEDTLHDGDHALALTGLHSFFVQIRGELSSNEQFCDALIPVNDFAKTTRRGLFHAVKEGVIGTELLPLAESVLPPFADKELEVIAAPYRNLLSDGYRLAGKIYLGLREFGRAATAFGMEMGQLSTMELHDGVLVRLLEAFSQRTDAYIEGLNFAAAKKHLQTAESIVREFGPDVKAHDAVGRFQDSVESQRSHISNLVGMAQRIAALQRAAPGLVLKDPGELLDNLDDLLRSGERAVEAGKVFPQTLEERIHLLRAMTYYLVMRDDYHSLGSHAGPARYFFEEDLSRVFREHSDLYKIFRNAAHAKNDSPRFDESCYHTPPRLLASQTFVRQAALLAAADTATVLAQNGEFGEAALVYRWMHRVLGAISEFASPRLAVVRLNRSEAEFQRGDIDHSASEALGAHEVLAKLGSDPHSELYLLDGHAFLRMARCAHLRISRVPDFVADMVSMSRGSRGHVSRQDAMECMRKSGLMSSWEVFYDTFRDTTGCDLPLGMSGHAHPGLRITLSADELADRLTRHYRRSATLQYHRAGELLHGDAALAATVTGAFRHLARGERPDFVFEPLPLPAAMFFGS
jgi:hypothetical protein